MNTLKAGSSFNHTCLFFEGYDRETDRELAAELIVETDEDTFYGVIEVEHCEGATRDEVFRFCRTPEVEKEIVKKLLKSRD